MSEKDLILIIDDEEEVLDLASFTLKSVGYDVVVAEHAYKAVDVLKSNNKALKLVVCDVRGIGDVEFILKLCKLRGVPFVVYTGSLVEFPSNISVIRKPATLMENMEMLRHKLSNNKGLSN